MCQQQLSAGPVSYVAVWQHMYVHNKVTLVCHDSAADVPHGFEYGAMSTAVNEPKSAWLLLGVTVKECCAIALP